MMVAAACVVFVAAAAGCGGDDSSSESPSVGATSSPEPAPPEEIGPPVGTATGDPCDPDGVEAAQALGPIFDCDPKTEKLVTDGMRCNGPSRTGVGGNLECDTSRECGGYSQWWAGKPPPCELGKPHPSPGITPPPTGEGDPCVPGQPVPPGFKCE